MPHPLRIGVIGAGRIGAVHARTIAYRIPQAKVVAIADPSLDAAQKLGHELGISDVAAAHHRMLAGDTVDAVLVCSSTDTHATIVTEAAAAKKHVFCEKPLDLTLPKIDAALAAVRQARVKLQLGFNRRFDPDFATIAARVRAGDIGTPQLLRITSRDPAPPPLGYVKVSGGMFLDMTIHDFDMARFVCGEVEELFVHAASLADPEIGRAGDVDTAIIALKFASGALGAIDNSRRAVYGYDQRLEVFGSKGMLANAHHTAHQVQLADGRGIHSPLPLDFFMQRYTEAYEAEMRAFVRCVVDDLAPPATGEDGRRAILLGYAAQKSLREKRPVNVHEVAE